MWQNGMYVYDTKPGVIEYASKGIGKLIGVLFMYSPYFLLPYLLDKWIDPKPEPFLWAVFFVVPGALLFYYGIKFVRQQLRARVAVFFFVTTFLVLRIWIVQAGFALLMQPWQEAVTVSKILAGFYLFFHLAGHFNRKFPDH
jgi:hypothetical protein